MTTITRVSIDGMTGKNCVAEVSAAVKAVPGVGRLTVELKDDATAVVSILSASPLDSSALRAAIGQVGFTTTDISVTEDALAQQMREQAPARQAHRSHNPPTGQIALDPGW